jgi:hypothetical protein
MSSLFKINIRKLKEEKSDYLNKSQNNVDDNNNNIFAIPNKSLININLNKDKNKNKNKNKIDSKFNESIYEKENCKSDKIILKDCNNISKFSFNKNNQNENSELNIDDENNLNQINKNLFSKDNSIINLLSQNALNLYINNSKGENIDEYYLKYLKSKRRKSKRKILKYIISTNEFLNNAKNYEEDSQNKTTLSNDSKFLNKKYKLNNDEDHIKSKTTKKKVFKLIKGIKDRKKQILRSNSKGKKNEENELNKSYKNNVNFKLKSNKIIKEEEKEIKTNIEEDKIINLQNIFIKQFIGFHPDNN